MIKLEIRETETLLEAVFGVTGDLVNDQVGVYFYHKSVFSEKLLFNKYKLR